MQNDETTPDPFGDDGGDELGLDVEVATGWTLGDALAEDEAADRLLPQVVQHVKATRPPGWLALLLLGIVTLVCVVAIAATLVLPALFDGVDQLPSDAIQPLTTLATLGVGALAALLGGENSRSGGS